MKDATYIQVKEGKLWASDMVKDSYYYDGAMEAFNQSFIEVGNPEIIQEHLRLHFDGDGLHEVSGLQFEVEHQHCIRNTWFALSEHGVMVKYKENDPAYRKVAILSLKQEQECESSDTGKHRWGEYIEGAPRCYFCGEAFFNSDKQEQPSEEKEIPAYEYCSVICDTIDDLLTQGGVRPLDRSVGLMMKIASELKKAGFRIVKD